MRRISCSIILTMTRKMAIIRPKFQILPNPTKRGREQKTDPRKVKMILIWAQIEPLLSPTVHLLQMKPQRQGKKHSKLHLLLRGSRPAPTRSSPSPLKPKDTLNLFRGLHLWPLKDIRSAVFRASNRLLNRESGEFPSNLPHKNWIETKPKIWFAGKPSNKSQIWEVTDLGLSVVKG